MEPWSPDYEQPITQVSDGSPQLQQPEESVNFGPSDSNSLLMTLANVDPTSTPTPTPVLPSSSSNFENLMSQPMDSKEEFYDENLFDNGMCKDSLMEGHNFLQTQSSATRAEAFAAESSMHGYSNQAVPNQAVPSQAVPSHFLKRGSFGVLPHEIVTNHAPPPFERNSSETYSTQPPSVSFNNGPYADRDGNNIYSSAPLSAQSALSGDTASHSPVITSNTSPSLSATFSSPDNYFNSPKTNFGAYNSMQSPMPLSPSVAPAAASYPSSPFANVDPSGHISSTTPCSPMGGGTFMNNINAVPQRNGQKTQHSPSNSSANMCYNNQNMAYGPQPVLQKTPPDYHSEYGYTHDHNPVSSYNTVYSSMHPGHMPGGNNSRISPRTHVTHPTPMPHDGRMSYGNSNTMATAPISSPTYLQNQISHDNSYRPCSSSINPGQSMHPPRFPPSMNTLQNNNLHLNPTSTMSDHAGNPRHFNFLTDHDGQKSFDAFNLVEPGNQQDPVNSFSHFLENDLQMLDGAKLTAGRQLRPSDPNDLCQNSVVNMNNSTRAVAPCPPVSKEPQNDMRPLGTLNYPYSSSQLDPVRPGNFSLTATGRRRGRRGRKRKVDVNSGNIIPRYQSFKDERNIYSNGYPVQPSNMLDYRNVDCYNAFKKRLCDEKELPPVNYPLSRYRHELKMKENQKKSSSVVLFKPTEKSVTVNDDLHFLNGIEFPVEREKDSPHTFMTTRNKNSEGFLLCYRKFLTSRKPKPGSVTKSPEYISQSKNVSKDSVSHGNKDNKHVKPIPKLIIKMDTHNSLRTYRLENSVPPGPLSGDESASDISGDIPLSSHIKKENDAEEKSKRLKHSGKLNKSKHSAKNKRTARYGKCNDIKEYHQTNSENLPAGKMRVKPEIESSPECDVDLSRSPKKRGHKTKTSASKSEPKKRARKSSLKATEPSETANFVAITIKQEKLDDDEKPVESTRRTLRSRRDTTSSVEALPGPSIKVEKVDEDNHKEPIDISSDEVEPLDDSDDDMDWMPTKPKGGDHPRSHLQMAPKKRGPRPGRRNSAAGAGSTSRQKKEKPETTRKRSTSERGRKASSASSLIDPNIKVKKEKDRFLVAKEDIDKKNPFLWRVDKETNMLQRFELYEQQGIIDLYRSTYTYAAWNEKSFYSYVTANVKTVSHSRVLYVVEYLGPEEAEVEYLGPKETESTLPATEDKTAPATKNEPAPTTKNETAPTTTNDENIPASEKTPKENFDILIQSLFSQALDPNFLTEITMDNDMYFIGSIKEIEKLSETKKKVLTKEFWGKDLLKSVNTYPAVDVIDITNTCDCESCKKKRGTKLLQFHGQPYDYMTFGSVELVSSPRTQYNVCDECSASLSLYCRLQHQTYNFFIKCRAKMNDAIGALKKNVKDRSSFLMQECLRDAAWTNSLFEEIEAMWELSDTIS